MLVRCHALGRRLGLRALVCLAAVAAPTHAVRLSPPSTQLEVANVADCPVEILEGRTRVAATLARSPWEGLRPNAGGRSHDPPRGPGEHQLVLEVGFRNIATSDVLFVAFLWEALDGEGVPLWSNLTLDGRRPLAPREPRTSHEVVLDPAPDAKRYRVSVYHVALVEGRTWSHPTRDARGAR